MKRKGDLTNQALSVIIAVIGILLIAYGIYKLYDAVRNNENKNAQKTIDVLNERIKFLEKGNSGVFTIQGFKNSKEWYITGWTGGTGPDKCFLSSCLCICKGDSITAEEKIVAVDLPGSAGIPITESVVRIDEGEMIKNCQSAGYCRDIDFDRVEIKDSLIVLSQGLSVVNASVQEENSESKLKIERVR